MERNFSRGLDMFNPKLFADKKVGIIGAGGIGSNSAYCLAKMGVKVKVCDFDAVDTVNTSSQFYSMTQLGESKVRALYNNIVRMADENIEVVEGKYEPGMFDDCDILVLALDSLAVRKQVIETCKDEQFILDTRMVRKLSIINCLYGIQRDLWLERERDEKADEQAGETRCTEKAVAFNALGMACLVGSLVADFLNGKQLDYQYMLDLNDYSLYKFN